MQMPVRVNSTRLSRGFGATVARDFRLAPVRRAMAYDEAFNPCQSRVDHSDLPAFGGKQLAHNIPNRNSNRWRPWRDIGVALLLFGSTSGAAYADESGISYWLPGRFSSLAATPQVSGWSMAVVYYHTSVEASGAVAAARQIQIGRFPATVNVNLNASLNAQADLVILNPTYTFGTRCWADNWQLVSPAYSAGQTPASTERSLPCSDRS